MIVVFNIYLDAFLFGTHPSIHLTYPSICMYYLFVARLAGQKSEELDELEQQLQDKSQAQESNAIAQLITRAKKMMFSLLGNLGFFGILLFASVRCPLITTPTYNKFLILSSLPFPSNDNILITNIQIPNPLFDLAGITCGHFLVPFWTFFGATLIGKSVVKAHLQVIYLPLSI